MISEKSHIQMGLRPHFDFWQTTRFKISLHQPLVMGIVNVTPDSFSNQKWSTSIDESIDTAKKLLEEGADILDVGGESTRPGSTPIPSDLEWKRVKPVLTELVKWNVPISIDTYHAETMKKALDLGVDIVNDIYALRTSDALDVLAHQGYQCGICLMHMHSEPQSMNMNLMTGQVIRQIEQFFIQRMEDINRSGISINRIVIDPGIGFGKTVEQNFQILRNQHDFLKLNIPILVGWSRKSSLGAVTGLAVENRMLPSVIAALIAVQNGASIVRVHDVSQTQSALKVWKATTDAVI